MSARPGSWLWLALVLLVAPAARGQTMQQIIDQAIASGQASVTITPGRYEIQPSGKRSGVHLYFENARNLEVVATGVTWVFKDPAMAGVAFNGCDGLTIRGLTIDYDPLPYTQGSVVAFNNTERWLEFQLHAGYPANAGYFVDRLAAYTYDPATRLIKRGSWDLYPSGVSLVRPGVFRLTFTSSDALVKNGTAIGDLLMLSRRAAGGVRFTNCTRVNVEDWTIHAAPGIAIQEADGPGNNRYAYKVTYGPKPAGATEARLHSANADGFHSSTVERGPMIENCLFEGMGDDAITIHNQYSLIMSSGFSSGIIASPMYGLPIKVGDPVTVYDGTSFAIKGKANVTNIAAVAIPTQDRATIDAAWQKYNQVASAKTYHQLTLSAGVGVAIGDLISSPSRTGGNFTIRNNTIRNHRARGMLIKSGPGLIENNVIDGSSFAGIALGPEVPLWLGGDFVQGVTVRNNVVRNTGYHGTACYSTSNIVAAGIVVHAATHERTFSPTLENHTIRIENNAIEGTASVALMITSAKDVTVTGNRIGKPATIANPTMGGLFGVNARAAVYVAQCQNVSFDRNTVDLAGGGATAAVAYGVNAGVVNAGAGLREVRAKSAVNFGSNLAAVPGGTEAGLIGLRQARWNGAATHTGSAAMVDASGAVAGNAAWLGDGVFNTTATATTGDALMMRGYLYADAAGATVTVTGLPDAFINGYELVVYYDATVAGVNSGPRVAAVDYGNNGSEDVAVAYTQDDANFSGAFVETPAAGANYVVVRSTASVGQRAFKLTLRRAAAEADTERGVITGLQVVAYK